MQRLTGLDASFLYLETPEMPMHVGSFSLCELPTGFRGSFHKAVQRHVAKRLHLAPVFTRKLLPMPLNLGHPAWVQAKTVDIDFHVRRAGSAKKGALPMTLAQAHQRCAQLHGELIDRRFPLWEFHVFDRIALPDGRVVAGFLSKLHHAALDGKGAVMLAHATLDTSPVPRPVPPPDPGLHRQAGSDDGLGTGQMLGSVLSTSLGQFAGLARALPQAARAVGRTLIRQATADPASGARARMPFKLAPHTLFNIGIGTERVFAAVTLPLQQCKALGKAVGGSLNDLLLWICSTALRDYLSQHASLPRKSLVASMPVSLRAETADAGAGVGGNQVGMTLVELGTQMADPLQRMNAIMASTAKVKSSLQSLKGLLPTDYPSLLAPWLVGGLGRQVLSAYGKSGLASRLPVLTNLAISNVPGSPVTLYLAGARILGFHPLSIITHGVALNITLQTYDGQVDLGIVADSQALPRAEDLAQAIEAAFAQAQALTGSAAAQASPAPPPKRAARPRQASVRQETKKPMKKSASSTKRRHRLDTGLDVPDTVSPHVLTPPTHGKNPSSEPPATSGRRSGPSPGA